MRKSASVNHESDRPDPADASTGARVLDLLHLSRQTFGDEALEAELLSLFDRQAAQVAARLAEPSRPGDLRSQADIAHTLKGAARAIGAFALGAAAEAYEAALRAGAPDDAALRAGLIAAIGTARAAVAARLERA
jgi:HPt (histidine-containing phosphotransfer) domain-containing protein